MLPRTRDAERWQMARFLLHTKGLALTEVTPALLSAWCERRRAECAPTTLQKELRALKRLFRFLCSQWYIPADPSTNLDPSAIKTVPTTALTITHQQEQELLTQVIPRTALKILLALDAGLRAGECAALRANHISLEEATLTVWASKTRNWRTIPLTVRLQRTIADRLRPDTHPDALLLDRSGRQLRWLSHWLAYVRPKLGFYFRFHDLRHTFASRLAASGARFHVIRALLGHRPSNITELYLHPSLEELREAIDALEEFNQAHTTTLRR